MILAVLVGGVLLGWLAGWLPHRAERTYLRAELRVAQERLLGAWQSGAVMPPRSDAPGPEPVPALPGLLQGYVDDWENPESRAAQEAVFRKQYFEQGMSEKAIVLALEDARRE